MHLRNPLWSLEVSLSYDDVEDALFFWLKRARSVDAPASATVLKEKAINLARELKHCDFNDRTGALLDRYKKRRAIVFRIVTRGSESLTKTIG